MPDIHTRETDPATALRLRLLTNGYPPLPVLGPKADHKDRGKATLLGGWQRGDIGPDDIRGWAGGRYRADTNTGICCGRAVGLDLDILTPELAADLAALAGRMLPPTPLRRIGRAPKSLLVYRTTSPFPKFRGAEFRMPDGTKAQVEILAAGSQFVAYGVHPDTGREYEWPELGPDVVPLADLPEVTEEALRRFLKAAEEATREAGGQEIDPPGKARQEPPAAPREAPRPKAGAAGDSFFKRVNRAALDDLGAWVPKLFPRARWQANASAPPGMWRVTSADLGRDYEEDLSIHPIKGVQDFGSRKSMSPCDVVMEWGGAPDVQAAAFVLCEWIGRDPADLGWNAPRKAKPAVEPKASAKPKPAASVRDLDGFELHEDGVALAFAARFKDELRYCHHTGAWFQWTGGLWRREETKLAFSWARQVCRQLARESDVEGKVRAVLARAATAAAVERFAQSDRAFAVTSAIWDRDPWLLGTPGGTVDLRTGRLRPARQEDHITKTTMVAPAAKADCPRWRQFMEEVTGGDADLVRFLQQWAGYCLTGDTREEALLFIHGPGGNGKGKFKTTLEEILGEYCQPAAMETFTAGGGDKHPTDLAMLRGARMVCASETEEGRAWAEVRIKQLTGNDTIAARFMRQDFFQYRPTFKLTIIGNHKPVLRNVDDAARRRFNIVPFDFKPAHPDPALEAKLRAEYPAILRWMIEGCLDWQANGLVRPRAVTDATAEYFEGQDLMAQWLAERCEARVTGKAASSALYRDWSAWAKARGEEPGTSKAFSAAMERRHAKERTTAGVMFLGIKLLPSETGVW